MHGALERLKGHGQHNYRRGERALALEVAEGDVRVIGAVAPDGPRVDDGRVAMQALPNRSRHQTGHAHLLHANIHGCEGLTVLQLMNYRLLELEERALHLLDAPGEALLGLVSADHLMPHGDLRWISRVVRPYKVYDGRMRGVLPRLDYWATPIAFPLVDDLVIVACDDRGEQVCPSQQYVIRKVLVRERDDLVNLGVQPLQLLVQLAGGLVHGHHCCSSAAESTISVNGAVLTPADTEPKKGHGASTRLARTTAAAYITA
mmetsp:Transcript_4240/g.13644  ORF Transcript_4240/g.13644 Transcript_4240/m.13644 type:complete len:261 (+) Transcript_4240:817-1599(+)